MSIKNGDTPTMAFEGGQNNGGQPYVGLTKREQFAAMAMQGMLSNRYVRDFSTEINDDAYDLPNGLANNAVRYADALLAQLEEKGDE